MLSLGEARSAGLPVAVVHQSACLVELRRQCPPDESLEVCPVRGLFQGHRMLMTSTVTDSAVVGGRKWLACAQVDPTNVG
jgi:hypothetical protein